MGVSLLGQGVGEVGVVLEGLRSWHQARGRPISRLRVIQEWGLQTRERPSCEVEHSQRRHSAPAAAAGVQAACILTTALMPPPSLVVAILMHVGAGISLRISLGFPMKDAGLFFHQVQGQFVLVSEVSAHVLAHRYCLSVSQRVLGVRVCAPAQSLVRCIVAVSSQSTACPFSS